MGVPARFGHGKGSRACPNGWCSLRPQTTESLGRKEPMALVYRPYRKRLLLVSFSLFFGALFSVRVPSLSADPCLSFHRSFRALVYFLLLFLRAFFPNTTEYFGGDVNQEGEGKQKLEKAEKLEVHNKITKKHTPPFNLVSFFFFFSLYLHPISAFDHLRSQNQHPPLFFSFSLLTLFLVLVLVLDKALT